MGHARRMSLIAVIFVSLSMFGCGGDDEPATTNNGGANNGGANNGGTNNGGTNNGGTNNGGTNNGGTNNGGTNNGGTNNGGTNNGGTNNGGGCASPCTGVANATGTCENGTCVFACDAGYVDINGDVMDPNGDGCECMQTNGGTEICDGQDNDCDGQIDEDATDATTWYEDADADDFGDDTSTVDACDQPDGYVDNGEDCNDNDDTINPDATESCDGVDDDCDGETDEDFTDLGMQCSAGVGVCMNTGQMECTSDGTGTECSVTADSPPVSDEATCDGKDNDCDMEVDEGCDDDMDGYCDGDFTFASGAACTAGDCDDEDDTVYPDAPGACDGKDNDCNGDVDDVRLVSTSPQTFTISGTAGAGSEPPESMAVATDDGFCVAQGTGNLIGHGIRFTHVDSMGNTSSHSANYTGGGGHTILDMAWTGTSCIALAREQVLGSIGTATEYRLQLFRWEPGTTDIVRLQADADDLYPDENPDTLNAAMHIVPPDPSCTILCLDKLAVAYVQDNTSSANHRVVYRETGAEFTSSTVMTANEHVIDTSNGGNPDIVMGPAPSSSDEWLVFWKDSGTNIWYAATRPGNSATPDPRSGLALNDSGGSYDDPAIGTVSGTTYLAIRNVTSGDLELKTITSNYGYDLEYSVNDVSGGSYPTRNLFVDNLRQTSWTTTSMLGGRTITITNDALGWMLQPYSDEINRFVDGLIITAGAFTNPNFSTGDELLSINKSGDFLQVLRMENDDPFDVAIDEFTCY